jgi:hypothetical protein
MDIYSTKNKDTNRKTAIGLGVAIIANELGLLAVFGLNLASMQLPLIGVAANVALKIAGLAWITFGLYKHKFN